MDGWIDRMEGKGAAGGYMAVDVVTLPTAIAGPGHPKPTNKNPPPPPLLLVKEQGKEEEDSEWNASKAVD
jgi:hypothetical protein